MARNSSGYMKAVIGVVLIIIIITVVNNLSKKADLENYGKYKAGVENNKKLRPFSEPQKDSVGKIVAGFWTNDKLADSTGAVISDRIEIKDNGIVWRVLSYKYPQESGDSAVFVHAYTSYLRAFASNIDKPSLLTLDNKILQQVFAGTDTCYYNPSPDTTWILQINKDGLEMGGKFYAAYDTSDLANFFPHGAVKMVNAININQCNSGYFSKNFRELAIHQATSLQAEKEQK